MFSELLIIFQRRKFWDEVPETISRAWMYSVTRSPVSLPKVRRISRDEMDKGTAWWARTPQDCSQTLLYLLQPHRSILVVEAIKLIPCVIYMFTFFRLLVWDKNWQFFSSIKLQQAFQLHSTFCLGFQSCYCSLKKPPKLANTNLELLIPNCLGK